MPIRQRPRIHTLGLHALFGLAGLFGLLLAPAAHSNEALALMYYERPPFMMDSTDASGTVSVNGISADPSAAAMKAAGLPFRWHKFGAKRIMEIIQENSLAACGVGWFKTAEREQYAKFSRPIYRDKPWVALTPKKFTLPANTTIASLLTNKDNRILVKENFTYGGLDLLMQKAQSTRISTTAEISQMVQMIKANRADIMFLADEEASYLLEQGGFRASDFNLVRFPDMPKGILRYFMCSKKVPDEVIQKLNAVIRFEG
jgi:uncharacterized protein (TIGR02285 family)